MYVVCVTIFVKPENVNDFIEASKENARNTRNEPGNIRFDIAQAVDEPDKFFLYEVYTSEEEFKNHQQTEHYFKWRETVADWMAQARQGVKHYSVFPVDEDW